MAQTMLRQVAESWAIGITDADKLLRWAAYLYPVGLDIAHSDYHKHSAYIVENVDIAGCSRAEQAQLAALVRCHRKSLREKHFADVGTELMPLAILLRLAHIFNRTKRHQLPDGLAIRADGKHIELKIAPDWLEQNPLTLADLESEMHHLENAGYRMSINCGT